MPNQPSPPNQQLSRPASTRKTIHELIVSHKLQFANALPSVLTPDRFLRIALTTSNRIPKLAQCTQESVINALLTCAQLGIEPDGRRAHLIPYGDECQLIIDYKGLAELVRRSGEVSSLHADVVCENDEFNFQFGSNAFLFHKPNLRQPRGAVFAAYSFVLLKDGTPDFNIMRLDEIDAIRNGSPGYQYAIKHHRNDNPWMTYPHEMQKKTVFRRHAKWLPLSAELREKIDLADEPTEQQRIADAKPANVTSAITFTEPEPPEPKEPKTEQSEPKTEQKPAQTEQKPERKKKTPPPRATALEVVRNLLKGSQLEEGPLLAYLYDKLLIEEGDRLDSLNEEKLKIIIGDWAHIVTEMQRENAPAEPAPATAPTEQPSLTTTEGNPFN